MTEDTEFQEFHPTTPYIATVRAYCGTCGTEVHGEFLVIGQMRITHPYTNMPLVVVPVAADDSPSAQDYEMAARTLPDFGPPTETEGLTVTGYEPFTRPVGAASQQLGCTPCQKQPELEVAE